MKITLVNSYSDYNKGDLGILLGTIKTLNKADKGIELNAVSSFNSSDIFFKTHHSHLKKQVLKIYPAIIGRLYSKYKLLLYFELLVDIFRMFIIYFGPFLILKRLLFTNSELETLKHLKETDIVISKGGSFICNQKGIIGLLRFVREMTILVISIRMNKKLVIWGQSIGPVYGFISLRLVNWLLKKSSLTVVREKKCIEKYNKINFPEINTIIGYDLAFNILDVDKLDKKAKNNTVGITIKRFNDKVIDDNYSKVIKDIIEFLIKELNKNIVIVPHVTIDDDIDKSFEIYRLIDDQLKYGVQVFTQDYDGMELTELYNNFDFLIGTRLHSTIFAMTTNTKAINIAYHGTKASGVFENFNISDFVIAGSDITTPKLKKTILKLIAISDKDLNLKENVKKAQLRNLEIAKKILLLA